MYKRQGLDNGNHKNNTENVFKLSLANNFYDMLNNSKLILEYVPNINLNKKIDTFLKRLDYKPNRISYKKKIAAKLYENKKYYLD